MIKLDIKEKKLQLHDTLEIGKNDLILVEGIKRSLPWKKFTNSQFKTYHILILINKRYLLLQTRVILKIKHFVIYQEQKTINIATKGFKDNNYWQLKTISNKK